MARYRLLPILAALGLLWASSASAQSGGTHPGPAAPGETARHGAKSPARPQPAKPGPTRPAVTATPPPAPEPAKVETPKESPKIGSVTQLPLPRFAALRSDDVNLRVGPGTRYPISWVYKRRDLPVQIEREYEVWRLVADPEGNRGWVHQATLTGRRTFILRGEARTMRRSADDGAAPVAILKPGVVGRVLNCAAGAVWCEVQVSEYRGYLRRDYFWGTFPGEAVN